jgi:hypothetical protein
LALWLAQDEKLFAKSGIDADLVFMPGSPTLIAAICIGNLNHLFFLPELYRRTREPSITFLFDENPGVASVGLGGVAVGGARSVADCAARSHSERAVPSASVGKRFSAPQVVWNRSNRCASARGGARVGRPRWLILIIGRQWRSQVEWFAHAPLAIKAGLAPEIVAELKAKSGRRT